MACKRFHFILVFRSFFCLQFSYTVSNVRAPEKKNYGNDGKDENEEEEEEVE